MNILLVITLLNDLKVILSVDKLNLIKWLMMIGRGRWVSSRMGRADYWVGKGKGRNRMSIVDDWLVVEGWRVCQQA